MIELSSGTRLLDPPLWVVREALSEPDRDPARPWLKLRTDERPPVIREERPSIFWDQMWTRYPMVSARFDTTDRSLDGTELTWTLLVSEPVASNVVAQLRRRLHILINSDLWQTFDQ